MRRRRGMTLIEVLVVIAIVLILAGILFPILGRARERGRRATCVSNLRQIAFAIRGYADDNKGQFPGQEGVADGTIWRRQLTAEVNTPDGIYKCPSGNAKGTLDEPSYGMNFALYGRFEAEVDPEGTKSARIVLATDVKPSIEPPGLLKTADDVDETRHDKSALAAYLDGHADKYGGSLMP